MRLYTLTPLTATSLPFLLLAAILVSVILAPRTQSGAAIDNTAVAHQAVRNLPLVVVNATIPNPIDATTTQLVKDLARSSAASCTWMSSSLRMPYFSFAKPRLSTNGI